MDIKVSEILKYTLSAAVAGVLLYFSFKGVKWEDFVHGLEQCRWGYVALSMAAGAAAFWLRAVRWRRLLVPIDPDTGLLTVFNAVNIGYIANFVIPRIGEFVRCGVISRNSSDKRASYEAVLGTVVVERAWDMVSMLALLVLLLAAKWDMFGAFFVEKMLGPLSERLSFNIWWVLVCCAAVAAAAVWVIWKLRSRNALCGRIWGIFSGIGQGLSSCMKMKGKWLFLADTVLIWAMYWFMAASMMWAVPELDSLGAVDALFLSLAGSLGWLVPVPGGFGAFHFIVATALSTIYGLPFSMGIIFATLSHEAQAVTMVLFGGGSFASEVFRRRNSA